MENKIRVLIAEDLEPIRKKYVYYLSQCADIELVGSAESGKEAVETALSAIPDVILMDIEMETRTAGLDAASQILSQYPQVKIIILTSYEDDDNVFQAFKLGVSDYVLKNSGQEELITCVKDAYYGRSPIRPVIAEKIRREFQRVKQSEDSFLYNLMLVTQLTQTEIDILDLLRQGYERPEICAMRCVEMTTLKRHIHNILKKFDLDSMAEVVKRVNDLKIYDYLHNVKNMDLKDAK